MTSRFASLTEEVIEKIVEGKDTQNTERSTKVAKELFADYLKEKKLSEPEPERVDTNSKNTHFMSKREPKNSFNV